MPDPLDHGPPPLSSVVITAREIYDGVVRLTGRVDVLIAQQQALQNSVADHELRLRSLERARWPLPSVALIVGVLSLLVSILRT